jgi:hypothetical protein
MRCVELTPFDETTRVSDKRITSAFERTIAAIFISKLAVEPDSPSELQFWIAKLSGAGGFSASPVLVRMGAATVRR